MHQAPELTILELVINLLMEQLVIHQREIVMDIERKVVIHLSLRAGIQIITDEANQGMCAQLWSNSRSTP